MYTLKNLRNMMKNHTGMLVLLVISMFVSFGVLFFGVGLYYQYSKNIEDGEIDSYAVGFSINDIITKKNFCEFVKNMPNKLMGDVSYITCFSSTQVAELMRKYLSHSIFSILKENLNIPIKYFSQ